MDEDDPQAGETNPQTPFWRKEEMNDTKDPGSPQAVLDRAKKGESIMGARIATGEPGTKQPKHDDARLSASKTVEALNEMTKSFEGETIKSSDERAKQSGNANKIKPEDRKPSRGPAVLGAAATAASALGAARDHMTSQYEADARLASDPRYERDQKVYELGQTGKLGRIAPSPAEAAAQAERTGVSADVAKLIPKSPEEQVAQDMPRLEAAEKAGAIKPVVEPGEQDGAEKNNGKNYQEQGRTGDAAVAKAKSGDAHAPGSPTPTNHPIK